MTPRPPHIRDRMIRNIAHQIAALPDGGAWQLDERLAGLLGLDVQVAARAIRAELECLRRRNGIRCVLTQTVVDNRELRPIAVFHSLTGD